MSQIESHLMQTIVFKHLSNGLASDEEISQMTQEDKEKLFEIHKQIIQEFQKQADKQICSLNINLRILNDQLFDMRKRKALHTIKETQNHEIASNKKPHENINIHHAYTPREPLKTSHSNRSPRNRTKLPVVSVPKRPKDNKNKKPPFHH